MKVENNVMATNIETYQRKDAQYATAYWASFSMLVIMNTYQISMLREDTLTKLYE